MKAKLLDEIRKKLTPKPHKIRSDIEVSCFSYDGIEAVKKALIIGKNYSTDEMPIKVLCLINDHLIVVDLQINLIAAPLFVVSKSPFIIANKVRSI